MQEIQVPFPCREDPLEEEMATQCSISAWRIPRAEEPGGRLTQLTLGSGLGLGWGLGSELSSLTTKQFSHERREWAVKKDPSPGSGRTEAKYTHTPCCPPKVLWEVYSISNDGPPCATGGSRVNPSERKAGLGKAMKWVWGHDEPVSGSLCWPVPQLLVSTLIRQPPASVTGRGNDMGGSRSLNLSTGTSHCKSNILCICQQPGVTLGLSVLSLWSQLFPETSLWGRCHRVRFTNEKTEPNLFTLTQLVSTRNEVQSHCPKVTRLCFPPSQLTAHWGIHFWTPPIDCEVANVHLWSGQVL